MGQAARIVAPRVHEGRPGIDRLGGRQTRALEDIIRGHLRAEARDRWEVTLFRLVARETAKQRVPHVPVGFDQARHDDHAAAVDLLAAACDVLADGHDRAVAHMHRAARDVAERVHRHHIGVGNGELAARRQGGRAGGGLRLHAARATAVEPRQSSSARARQRDEVIRRTPRQGSPSSRARRTHRSGGFSRIRYPRDMRGKEVGCGGRRFISRGNLGMSRGQDRRWPTTPVFNPRSSR